MFWFIRKWSSRSAIIVASLGCGSAFIIACLIAAKRNCKVKSSPKAEEQTTICENEPSDCNKGSNNLSSIHQNETSDSVAVKYPESNIPNIQEKPVEQWEFEFPSELCGRLVGKNGRNIKALMMKTSACVVVVGNNPNDATRLIRISGRIDAIKSAVSDIRCRYPDAMLVKVNASTELIVGNEKFFQKCLPPVGETADVGVSHIDNANHLYLQLMTQHHIKARYEIDRMLTSSYNQKFKKSLSFPVAPSINDLVAVPYEKKWYRGKITTFPKDDKTKCHLQLVDHGDTLKVPWKTLRKLRDELLCIPFEAIECYLAYVSPLEGEDDFPTYASAMIEDWTNEKTLQCSLIGTRHDNLPLVELHSVDEKGKISFINRDLVTIGLARWIESNT